MMRESGEKEEEGASQLDLLLGDLEDDDELATIEAELGISNDGSEEFAMRPMNRPQPVIKEDQNELAIVEEFNQKYRNDGMRPDSKSIKAIFVVKFDVNEGNIIEWQYPRHFDLAGVEFKAMVSGSHNVDDDIVYFKSQDHYGVACYSRLLVKGNSENRGAIMRSIGVLMSDFTTLHEHKLFLTAQVEAMNQAPGNFGPLLAYYQESQLPAEEASSPEAIRLNGPRGYFTEFTDCFGVHAFAIWKSILLRKRILFHSPPPIRKACRFVYASSFLAFTRVKRFKFDPNPLFYINVNDIKTVQEQENYIACTTETILQKKFHLYDLYVKKHTIHLPNKEAQIPLNITEGDTLRFAYLDQVMGSPSKAHVEDQLLKFFIGLNNKLFQGLLVACERNEVVLVNELPERFGLHKSDAPFLRALAEVLNLNLVISDDVGCWFCC